MNMAIVPMHARPRLGKGTNGACPGVKSYPGLSDTVGPWADCMGAPGGGACLSRGLCHGGISELRQSDGPGVSPSRWGKTSKDEVTPLSSEAGAE